MNASSGGGRAIAVTGANGFIGGHVCRALLAGGYEVSAVARDAAGIPSGATPTVIKDLSDSSALCAAFRNTDAVIHLAGHAHVMNPRREERDLYRKINVEGTAAVAGAAAAAGVQQVIFASSVKAIGEGGGAIIDDATPPHPLDDYGRSKLEAEAVVFARAREVGFAATVLRLALVYGPGVKGNMLRLFDAVWRGIPLPIGRIRNERSMLAIDNLAAFILRIIEKPLQGDTPFLLSDSERPSTEALVRIIADRLDRRAYILNVPVGLLRFVGELGDLIALVGPRIVGIDQIERLTTSLRVDSSRAWRAAGIERPVSLEQGIERTANWYRERARAQRG